MQSKQTQLSLKFHHSKVSHHIKPANKQSETFFLALRSAAEGGGEYSLSEVIPRFSFPFQPPNSWMVLLNGQRWVDLLYVLFLFLYNNDCELFIQGLDCLIKANIYHLPIISEKKIMGFISMIFSLSDDVQSHCKSLFFRKISFWFCYLNMKAPHFFFLHFLAYVITDKRGREKGIICYYYWFFRFFVSFMLSFNMIFQEISYFVSLVQLLSLFMYSIWSFCFVIEMPSSCLDL